MRTTNATQLTSAKSTPPGRITAASGMIAIAATIARSDAITIFCTPSAHAESGASRRSSISFVNEKSITQRQRGVLQRGEKQRQPEDARQQLRAVGPARGADLGQHAPEDEQVEERLQQALREEADRGRGGR